MFTYICIMKILLIEDEINLQKDVCDFLRKNFFVCETAGNFFQAEDKLAVYEYDVILLDLMLPDGNGLELFRIIKETNKDAGVIIISAKDSLDDKIKGLDLGADDYLAKPFNLSELNSRIRAVLRRRRFGGDNIISFNEIKIFTDSREVKINNTTIVLTKKEYELLLYFIINKNRVLTKEDIAEHLWNDNVDLADSFDFIYTHLNNLRKKIKKAGGEDYIKTLYGIGYKFTD